jgi:hypothetical protein
MKSSHEWVNEQNRKGWYFMKAEVISKEGRLPESSLHRLKERLSHLGWFLGGLAFGFTTLTFTLASVPKLETSSAESVELQDAVSEIKARKTPKLDFDSDIAALSAREKLYREDPRSILSSGRRSQNRLAQSAGGKKDSRAQSVRRSARSQK